MKAIEHAIALVITIIILWASNLAWQKYGPFNEDNRDSSAEGIAHYSK